MNNGFTKTNQAGKLLLEGLSPLFIGSGVSYSQLDYLSEEDKIHILDFNKILEEIPLEIVDDLTRDISQNFQNNIWRGNIQDFLNRYDIEWRNYIAKTYELIGTIGKNEINQFIKSGERIYIPGSSIKGAIRTSILFSILNNNPDLKKDLSKIVSERFDKTKVQRLIKDDGKTDLLRSLTLSDALLRNPQDSVKIAESNVYHLRNQEPMIPVFNEILEGGFIGESSIRINKELLNSGYLYDKNFQITKQELLQAITEFSREIIEYELEQFQQRNDPNLTEVIKFYRDLKGKINSLGESEAIIRLGQGSSVLGVTLYLVFKDDPDVLKRYSNLQSFTFDVPDRNNPDFAITRERRFTILIDREAENRPRLNETWVCRVVSTLKSRHLKFVQPIEKISGQFSPEEILYPLTRKFIIKGGHLRFPYGWVKLTWN